MIPDPEVERFVLLAKDRSPTAAIARLTGPVTAAPGTIHLPDAG